MKTNTDKFKALVSKEKSDTLQRNKERIKHRARLRESQYIALKVLEKLDHLKWSQRKLAQELKVSPQQVSKIVSGKENLTLETQVKLQEVLDIPILASYYEKQVERLKRVFKESFSLEELYSFNDLFNQSNQDTFKTNIMFENKIRANYFEVKEMEETFYQYAS
ncbi:helix-turn-helix domain-containing protein [Mesonia sp. K4-1]|jgi:transcriptional regulator with XRE-family HTH domain|uniref:helix-turn-helix transcriptional regulator n=1 Tax=Mesonia sp. K4-1 TaxID=2602760 RepID=UPI0011CA39CE|nr:helix-turn-helix domain-containing protein [Mesonia sp. K4-1]TXK79448.1 helix-turn-helix domain-containing protein [Mesonia sp. K4-1]|tara:strand:- start:112 stop:603 length:492 start_codon:yes stop_codon:yes gene_type:complete